MVGTDRLEQAATSRALSAIFVAGLLCGVMDITAAFLTLAPKGIVPRQILQGIASGLIGPSSFRGGWTTGVFGAGA